MAPINFCSASSHLSGIFSQMIIFKRLEQDLEKWGFGDLFESLLFAVMQLLNIAAKFKRKDGQFIESTILFSLKVGLGGIVKVSRASSFANIYI